MTDESTDNLIRDLLAIHLEHDLVDRTAVVVALIDLCQHMLEESTDIQGKAFFDKQTEYINKELNTELHPPPIKPTLD